MRDDATDQKDDVQDEYARHISALQEVTEISEAWEEEITVPSSTHAGYGVVMGYRIMSIDGDCDRTLS